jgi:hypothetical protein
MTKYSPATTAVPRHRRIGCVPRKPKKDGPCGKSIRIGISLIALLEEYKQDYRPLHKPELKEFRKPTSLMDAIEHATGLVGKVPDHQRRVGRKILKQALERLLRHQRQIKACTSFDALFHLVERITADIHRFGELAVYDTSLRLGVWLRKWPKKVYLHAGTRKGARALGMDVSRGYVEMKELPKPVQALKPWEAEDFLCIYGDDFPKLPQWRTT